MTFDYAIYAHHRDTPFVHADLSYDDPLRRTSTYTWDMPCSRDADGHAYPSRISRRDDLSPARKNDETSTRDDDRCTSCDLRRRPSISCRYLHLRIDQSHEVKLADSWLRTSHFRIFGTTMPIIFAINIVR